jgi:hypothetical protein
MYHSNNSQFAQFFWGGLALMTHTGYSAPMRGKERLTGCSMLLVATENTEKMDNYDYGLISKSADADADADADAHTTLLLGFVTARHHPLVCD